MRSPKPSYKPFTATVSIGLAKVRIDDDPDAWKVVSAALSEVRSFADPEQLKEALKVKFDGDLDNPSNFKALALVPGSLEVRSVDADRGQFEDLTFQVAGRALDASPAALEDLLHAIVLELSMAGVSVNVGDWEEYGLEAVSG